MSKAILIIEMPDRCYDCPLNYDSIGCRADSKCLVDFSDLEFDESKEKHKNCPLKPIPKQMEVPNGIYNFTTGCMTGFNDCVEWLEQL